MSYHLIKWTVGSQSLYKKRGGSYYLIAILKDGVWKEYNGAKFLDHLGIESRRQISQEEATMILFGCRGVS